MSSSLATDLTRRSDIGPLRVKFPNAVVDTGLLAALRNPSPVIVYYLIRAHWDVVSVAIPPDPLVPLVVASGEAGKLVADKLGVSGRTARRLISEQARTGWLVRKGNRIVLGYDSERGGCRFFFDAWLDDRSRRGKAGKCTGGKVEMRRRIAEAAAVLGGRPTDWSAPARRQRVLALPDGPARYTICDLRDAILDSPEARGAFLADLCLYRYSFTKTHCRGPRDGKRLVKMSQDFLGLLCGVDRSTIVRWIEAGKELGLFEVESQGHRKQNLYVLPERRTATSAYDVPLDILRIVRTSRASEAMGEWLDAARMTKMSVLPPSHPRS